ncbi:hypothetical protein ACIHCQ_12910 [Streptomyces sp. NPDC052236]|uniref:hypothetical protein n=1 Tax=Streptomyces sp. NPDC052236 TaxID=3365686 RepID=UPI0037CE26C9
MLKPGHTPEAVDVVAVRRHSSAPSGETTVVRLIGLLPAGWSCTTPEVSSDRVRLSIELGGRTDRETVCRAVREVLADTALRGWIQED